jgi:hypothetical protein
MPDYAQRYDEREESEATGYDRELLDYGHIELLLLPTNWVENEGCCEGM